MSLGREYCLDFSAYARHPPLEPCSTVSLSPCVTRPLSLSLSILLLGSLHSCSPFPRVINHALNCIPLSLSFSRARASTQALELAENLSPPPPPPLSRSLLTGSVCKSIRYRCFTCAYRLFHDRVVRKISGGRRRRNFFERGDSICRRIIQVYDLYIIYVVRFRLYRFVIDSSNEVEISR